MSGYEENNKSRDYLMQMFSLAGRTALVTGASRGIGRRIALGLARAGADLILVARSAAALAELAGEIEETGRRAVIATCDLSSVESVRRLFADLRTAGHAPNILVNNASTIRRGPPEVITPEEWDEVLNLNLRGSFFMAQEAGRLMIAEGYGKIIQVTSVLGFGGGAHVASYAASKGALISMTKALAVAWAPHGIRVNAIAPGYTTTSMTEPLYNEDAVRRMLTARIPLGRWADPDEMVGAAIYLSASASDYVTGHTLAVDGGWLAH